VFSIEAGVVTRPLFFALIVKTLFYAAHSDYRGDAADMGGL
jgi:hypothetical protein